MTKKRDPSTLKVRPIMDDPTVLAEWRAKLERAVLMANGNLQVIKKDTFWSVREVRARWGNRAVREFKYWFDAVKHYDAEKADVLLKEFESGKMDEEKYRRLLYTKAYTWMWVLREKRVRDVWHLTRGLKTINDLAKEWKKE